jgi:GTPase SAR1 family protein
MKVLLLGESGVGKTTFAASDHSNRELDMSSFHMGCHEFRIAGVSLELYDIPGHPGFYNTWASYIRDADIILLMFDLTDIRTLFKVKTRWLPAILRDIEPNSSARFYLIGNKSNLIGQRQVLRREAEAMAKQFAMDYYEPHNGDGIVGLLETIVVETIVVDGMQQHKNNDCSPTLRKIYKYTKTMIDDDNNNDIDRDDDNDIRGGCWMSVRSLIEKYISWDYIR